MNQNAKFINTFKTPQIVNNKYVIVDEHDSFVKNSTKFSSLKENEPRLFEDFHNNNYYREKADTINSNKNKKDSILKQNSNNNEIIKDSEMKEARRTRGRELQLCRKIYDEDRRTKSKKITKNFLQKCYDALFKIKKFVNDSKMHILDQVNTINNRILYCEKTRKEDLKTCILKLKKDINSAITMICEHYFSLFTLFSKKDAFLSEYFRVMKRPFYFKISPLMYLYEIFSEESVILFLNRLNSILNRANYQNI